jgi:DNA-binding NtrC family response regulator
MRETVGAAEPPKAPILVVDDDGAIVRAVRRLIEGVCPTLGATTIAEANQQIEGVGRLTALILDVHLAEGSGWEILVTARARDPLLPAMMLTGIRWEALAKQAEEFFAVPYEKPLEAQHARSFAADALEAQRCASQRMRGLLDELAERARLTPEEVSAVEASVAGASPDLPPSSPHGPPMTQVAHILSKTGAKSLRELRDSVLRKYFAREPSWARTPMT